MKFLLIKSYLSRIIAAVLINILNNLFINNVLRKKMNFTESVKTCFSKYADFKGRAVRSEYWWFILFTVLVSIGFNILSIPESLTMIGTILGAVFSLATLIPSLAAGVRRLHDTNRSGWWMLLNFIPIIGWIVIIVWMATEGSPEANQYD